MNNESQMEKLFTGGSVICVDRMNPANTVRNASQLLPSKLSSLKTL
jgi:hypothetical protein